MIFRAPLQGAEVGPRALLCNRPRKIRDVADVGFVTPFDAPFTGLVAIFGDDDLRLFTRSGGIDKGILSLHACPSGWIEAASTSSYDLGAVRPFATFRREPRRLSASDGAP
jgi:hypothetical protein